MEQILIQISKYHRLSIGCAAGLLCCMLISIYLYRKNQMKTVLECFWRNRKKRDIWMLLFCALVFSGGMKVQAAEIKYLDETGSSLEFSEDGSEMLPYYNAGEEIVIQLSVQEDELDLEQSYAILYRTDVRGKLLEEESLELSVEGIQKTVSLDGHYQLVVCLTDLEGNITLHEKKFALDHQPPMQPNIRYETENQGILKRWFHQLTFGYFAKEKVYAFILVEDLASDIAKVTYSYQDEEMEDAVTETVEMEQEPIGEIKVELPFAFKGHMQVQSEDERGNVSQIFCDIGVIAETDAIHQQSSKADILVNTKSLKTPGYYNGDVELEFLVQDTYSGVRNITYLAGTELDETISFEEITEIPTEEIVKEYTLSASENQKNEVEIGLQFLDFAGHETKVSEEQLPKIHIDTILPKVFVEYDNEEAVNENYYNEPRIATVTVQERNFDFKDVEFDIQGAEVRKTGWSHDGVHGCTGGDDPYHTGHMDACQWECQVEFFEDGEYEFGFSCTDLAGNESDFENVDKFIIDQRAPEIQVNYDNQDARNEIYYRAPRTGYITIREKNFHPDDVKIQLSAALEGEVLPVPKVSAWISNEDVHRAVIYYDYDGTFSFEISCEDLAGNEAKEYEKDYFCIDQTAPEITIEGVRHKSANQGAVIPVITMMDNHFQEKGAAIEIVGYQNGKIKPVVEKQQLLNGVQMTISDFPHRKENDDLYRLTAQVEDLAGNLSKTEIWYSINRFGSVYTLDAATQQLVKTGGDYYTTRAKQMVVTEINVDGLVFQEIVCNWNGELKTLEEGVDYTLVESGEEYGWKQYQYLIHAKNFEKEGHYVLTIYSKDRANNLSDNQSKGKNIAFGVDNTAPDILITGIEAGGTYREKEKNILIHVQDNVALKEVEVFLNGEKIFYDAKQLEELNGKILIVSKGNPDWQSIQVNAKDMAGNMHASAKWQFLVTPNLFIQLWNHKPMFYTSSGILTGICLLGGWAFRKRKFCKKSS